MNTVTKHLILTAGLGTALVCASTLQGQTPTGQWDFNSGDLTATVGSPLTYADGAGGATQSGTQFGSTTSFGIPNIGGTAAAVMRFPAATPGMGFLMPDPTTANGGGSQVNEWTLIVDVLYPTASEALDRPLIDSDGFASTGGGFVLGPDFVISSSGGLGSPPDGPYNGTVLPNTWYRIGISATASQVATYINGVQVSSSAGAGVDNRFAIIAGSTSLILSTNATGTSAGVGYVNSIQLRDVALNAGQMQALGGPSAAGIPQTIPPVPSFIQSRTPGANAQGVDLQPAVDVVLNQGDTTVSQSSIKLYFDGALLSSSINATPPTFDVTASIGTRLDPLSLHSLTLTWSDSVAGAKTSSWSFAVMNYQNINLPAPFYLETFDELTEDPAGPGPLPPGWTVANKTSPGNAGFSLDDRDSESYLNWVLVDSTRFAGWSSERTDLPPIILNGQMLTTLASGSLMWAESDQRCGGCNGQYQELYTADIDCTGKTNVYVAFKSIYEQNQDNMNCCEYSVDQGVSWLPVLYMFDSTGPNIIVTNGVIDVGQTFSKIAPDRNFSITTPPGATNYGWYIKAPISTALIPYIKGYINDDTKNGKEIVVVRLPQADGQSTVRFRFLNTGTSSWFWGIDDLGLYEINTPVILTQPQSQDVSAGSTVTISVGAQSTTPLTYQWKHAGTNLANAGHFSGATNATLTVSNCETNDAGAYICVVKNLYGEVNTSTATLTVEAAPKIITQPVMLVVSPGFPATFSVTALGRPPLTYQWSKDGSPVGQNSSTLTVSSAQAADAGRYSVSVSNPEGVASSTGVRLIVSPAAINGNLVVHLKFDGDYNDASGRGNNATAVGSPSFGTGKIGQALRYTTKQDGSQFDYASLGYPDDLKFTDTSDFSMSFWINYSLQVDDPPFISNKNWNSSGNRGWGIFSQGGPNFRANVTGSGGSKYDTSATPAVRDGTWHHIVMSYPRAGVVSLYLDGVLANTRNDTTTGTVDTDDLSLQVNIGQDGTGGYTDGGSAGITNALIDDVGFWRRALSPQEASAIYNAGQSGKDLSQAVVVAKVTITAVLSGSNLRLTWPGAPGVKMQQAANLTAPSWTDVPNTLGASSATVPITGAAAFFRLTQ